MSEWVKAWHFMADKGGKPVLRDGSPAPKVRKILRYDGAIKICHSGLHASRRLIDALEYAPGPWCAEVEVREIVEEQADKLVARERRILRVVNAKVVLWRFVVDLASKALEDAGVTDERSWTALTARQGRMVGMVSDEDLAAARDAASAAASAAAWAAAWAAERAAERDAASAAERAARDAQNEHLEYLMREAMR